MENKIIFSIIRFFFATNKSHIQFDIRKIFIKYFLLLLTAHNFPIHFSNIRWKNHRFHFVHQDIAREI